MKTKRWPLAILFALPFLLRLVYFLQTRDQPYFQWNFLVAYVNHTFAADLARGAGAPYALYRSPYYPLAVSWIYRLAGVEPMAVRLVQWLLGGAGCLLVYRLGIELLDRRRALVALALASLFVPSIYYEGELLEQSLAGFFVLAAVTLLAVAGRRRRAAPLVLAASILYGAGFLMRPDLILAAPFLFGALLAWPAPSPPSSPAPSSASISRTISLRMAREEAAGGRFRGWLRPYGYSAAAAPHPY